MAYGITVATQIRFSKSELQKMNGLCFLFDPQWNSYGSNRYNNNTLPMVLLYPTKRNDSMQSDVSTNQMLLYTNTNETDLVQPQLNVVADNIVNHPKEYQLECIVPFTFDCLINTPFNVVGNDYNNKAQIMAMTNTHETVNGYADLERTDSGTNAKAYTNLINTVITHTYSLTNIIINTMNALVGALVSSINITEELLSYITGVTSEPSYNKDSLEAMWRNRSILKLKLPNSWKYETVVIKGITMTKEGIDGKCYKATITLQEVPIMQITNTKIGFFEPTQYNTRYAKSMGEKLQVGLVGIGKMGDNGF